MSKTQDKKQERITEHAETLWNEAQMKAALMQQMLDIAVAEIEEHQEELEKTEHWAQLQQSMKDRQKDIEEFLMSKKDEYLKRMEKVNESK